nr:hypothetical protein [Nanoarchaeota archaeon]
MAENQKLQLENYKNLEKQLKETMNREQTVDSQTSFMKMKKQRENLEGNILKKRWYGDEKASDDNRTRDTSLLERGLNLLNTPLYGVVGATEAVLGKGSKRGLSNIGANIEEGGTFGDLLRSYNMNNAAAMPLGFALDLAFDPLIWATGGATALIPRVAYGATKAGIKGAGKGAASSFLQKAATASKIMPGVPTKKLTAKALKSGAEYNEMVGRSIKQILEKPRGVGNLPPLGEITEDFLSRSKVGRQVIDKFKLGNRDWLEEQMMSDITRRAKIAEGTRITGKPQELGEKALAATGDAGPSVLGKGTFKNDLDILSNPTKYIGRDEISDVSEVQKILDLGAQAATDSSTMARTLGKNLEGKMTQEFLQDKKLQDVWQKYKKTAKEISKDETGVKWFDNMEKKFKEDFVVRDKKVGQAIADTYEAFIGAFKTAKVPWNSAAYTNAVVGNLVMGQMAGLQMYNPEYIKNIVKSFKFVTNKLNKDDQLKFLKNFTDDAEWVKYIDEFPGTFTNVFGFDPKFFKGSAKELVSDAV